MLDLPIGKAIIAVLSDVQCNDECKNEDFHCTIDCCKGCEMDDEILRGLFDDGACGNLCCIPGNRKDGKHVIFKLVDYPDKK